MKDCNWWISGFCFKNHELCNLRKCEEVKLDLPNLAMPENKIASAVGIDKKISKEQFMKNWKDLEKFVAEEDKILNEFTKKLEIAKGHFLLASIIEIYEKGMSYEEYEEMVKSKAVNEIKKYGGELASVYMLNEEQVDYINSLRKGYPFNK